MKFEIINIQEDLFSSLSDLELLIPDGIVGKALNYGQGEGQVKIGETVWGIYVLTSTSYSFQFEEGEIPQETLAEFIKSIFSTLKKVFGEEVEIFVIGLLNDLESNEKYT